MNWYLLHKQAAQGGYWIGAQQGDKLAVGHVIKEQRLHSAESAAEELADALYERSRQKGLPVTHPVSVVEARWKNTQYGFGQVLVGTVQIQGPPKPTQKAAMWANQGEYVLLFSLYNCTSGGYGRNGRPDIPADKPTTGINWTPEVPEEHLQALDALLQGQEVVVTGQESGSFHTRWYRGEIYVRVPPELEDRLAELECYARKLNAKEPIIGHFEFRSIHQVVEDAAKASEASLPHEGSEGNAEWFNVDGNKSQSTPQRPDDVKPGMTPEQWWAKRTEIELAKKPKPLSGD